MSEIVTDALAAARFTAHRPSCFCSVDLPGAPCAPMLAAGMTPYPWQRAFLHSIRPGSRTAIVTCRQAGGKSSSTAAVSINIASVVPGRVVAVIGPSQSAPAEFVRKVKTMLSAMGFALVGDAKTYVEFVVGAGTSRIIALPANIETVRSLTAHAVVVEEARGVSRDLLAAALPFLTKTNGSLVLIGTAGGPSGPFYEHVTGDNDWTRFRVTGQDQVDAGLLGQSALDEFRELMTDLDYKREFECEFLGSEGAALDRQHLEDAVARGLLASDPLDTINLNWTENPDDDW